MTAMVVPARPGSDRRAKPDQHVQVMVNVQAEVLDPELVRRKANVWLLENAGNLLGAQNPELVLGDRLLWRYDVVLGIPALGQPGAGALYRVGQITLDAATGQVQNADTLTDELKAHAAVAVR